MAIQSAARSRLGAIGRGRHVYVNERWRIYFGDIISRFTRPYIQGDPVGMAYTIGA